MSALCLTWLILYNATIRVYPYTLKRINLEIDRKLAECFTSKAHKSGVPKSQLLRNWIQDIELLNFSSIPVRDRKNTISYTIRLPDELLNEIDDKADLVGLDRSTFLRMLMIHKLEDSLKQLPTKSETTSLWLHGKSDEIDELISDKDPESLNAETLVAGIRKSNEVGDYPSSITFLQTLSKKYPNNKLLLQILLIDMFTMQRDFKAVERVLEEYKMMITNMQDRYYWGKYYLYLGELDFYKDKLYQSRNYFFKATALLDSINYPMELARVYLRLGRLEECLLNFNLANTYFLNSYELAKKYQNNHYLGWFFNDYAFHFYLRNDLEKANKYIDISTKHYATVNNSKGFYYNNDHKGRFLLHKNEFEKSKKFLDKAANYLDINLTENCFNYSNFFRLFIKSKYNFKSIELEFLSLLKKHKNIKPAFVNYLYETTRFINSQTPSHRHEAAKKLEQMVLNTSYPLIGKAAKNTLLTKKLSPVR